MNIDVKTWCYFYNKWLQWTWGRKTTPNNKCLKTTIKKFLKQKYKMKQRNFCTWTKIKTLLFEIKKFLSKMIISKIKYLHHKWIYDWSKSLLLNICLLSLNFHDLMGLWFNIIRERGLYLQKLNYFLFVTTSFIKSGLK